MSIWLRLRAHQPLCGGGRFFFALLMLCLLGPAASAQTVIVQLVNGRNAKPLAGVKVWIGFDDLYSREPLTLFTNRQGEIRFEAKGAKTFQVQPIAVVACGKRPFSVPDPNYSIAELLRRGLVESNNCPRLNLEPLRGRLVYLGRRATWWELFKN